MTEGKGHRASYCNKRSGGCLLETSSLCMFLVGLCGFLGIFLVVVGSGGWVGVFSLFLFSQKC